MMCVVTLKKGYWTINNQNGGWKWNGNLYNILTKYKTHQQHEKGKPLEVAFYFISLLTSHNSVQHIYEDWDILYLWTLLGI